MNPWWLVRLLLVLCACTFTDSIWAQPPNPGQKPPAPGQIPPGQPVPGQPGQPLPAAAPKETERKPPAAEYALALMASLGILVIVCMPTRKR